MVLVWLAKLLMMLMEATSAKNLVRYHRNRQVDWVQECRAPYELGSLWKQDLYRCDGQTRGTPGPKRAEWWLGQALKLGYPSRSQVETSAKIYIYNVNKNCPFYGVYNIQEHQYFSTAPRICFVVYPRLHRWKAGGEADQKSPKTWGTFCVDRCLEFKATM